MSEPLLTIRPAVAEDVEVIMAFILELAEFQHLAHAVTGTIDDLRAALFSARPAAEVLLACVDGQPAGMALFFQNFSTFPIKPGIYLEDLYVRPEYRRLGMGKRLLGEVAKLAFERSGGGGLYEWSVIDWNEPSIRFYEGLGAVMHAEWRRMRVEGDALAKLAAMG